MQHYFYDYYNKVIETDRKFVSLYSDKYFSSPRVSCKAERIVENLLNQSDDYMYTDSDIMKFMIWKFGWCTPFEDDNYEVLEMYHFDPDFFSKIQEIQKEACIKGDNLENLYKSLTAIYGIGPIYAIAIIYLLSRGKYPIYDRYVRGAMVAIKENRCPGTTIKLKALSGKMLPKEYIEYIEFVKEFKGYKQNDRSVDRALWTYGHRFNIKL